MWERMRRAPPVIRSQFGMIDRVLAHKTHVPGTQSQRTNYLVLWKGDAMDTNWEYAEALMAV